MRPVRPAVASRPEPRVASRPACPPAGRPPDPQLPDPQRLPTEPVIVTARTLQFAGGGIVRCKRCAVDIKFTRGPRLVGFDFDGLNENWIVRATGGTVHRCGRPLVWWCASCNMEIPETEVSPLHTRQGRVPRLVHYPGCHNTVTQRQVHEGNDDPG